jgi:protein phosphatase
MSTVSKFRFDFAAVTDIGNVRKNNEDSYGFDTDQQLYVVCDGMGGMAAGEVASSMAVRALIESFAAPFTDAPAPTVEERLLRAIFEANRQVHKAGSEDPDKHRMGTTLVCVCFDGERMVVGNVGDSRAYLIRNGVALQITLDHLFLDEQVRLGVMTPEMAAASDLKSVITRAIGAEQQVRPDLFEGIVEAGDAVLLVSDGFTRYATPEIIAQIIQAEDSVEATCAHAVAYAKDAAGVDNITCLLIKVRPEAELLADTAPAAESPYSIP